MLHDSSRRSICTAPSGAVPIFILLQLKKIIMLSVTTYTNILLCVSSMIKTKRHVHFLMASGVKKIGLVNCKVTGKLGTGANYEDVAGKQACPCSMCIHLIVELVEYVLLPVPYKHTLYMPHNNRFSCMHTTTNNVNIISRNILTRESMCIENRVALLCKIFLRGGVVPPL